ncbi:MAG: HAD hydrolase family protein [Anaerolineae bacterium]|nr:HAD hydrolase family protein [Anaerolineae bacterium]
MTSASRILIVEDSLGVARALHRALGLHQDGVYRVETCESGEFALARLHEREFDLLISDFRLPGIDGLELIRRAQQITPEIRTILVTAFGSPEVEEEARKLTQAYIPKPFRLNDIIRVVERVLSEPSHLPPPVEPNEALARTARELAVDTAKRKTAHLIVLASDLDGTLAEEGKVSTETWRMLKQGKIAGLALILVTGRTLDSFVAEGPFAELCEAIVAENGAVIYFPRRETVLLPFGHLDPRVIHRLEVMNVPLERGMAIASTVVPYDEAILKALRDIKSSANVEYNRESVMLLPPGATKGTGLNYALRELGYSLHNVVACGDAENDRSLFEAVEMAVAVSNAQPTLKAVADTVLEKPGGEGVQMLVKQLLDGHTPYRQPRANRRLLLGHRASGTPVYLDPFAVIENNIGILGASNSGKSWLAGLLAEEMLKQGYQLCIIDPEGDYRGLATSPHTLLMGGPEIPLPTVSDVINFNEWTNNSLVLDISMYEWAERMAYMLEFLRALRGLRSRRGRPHCFLVDEIQHFCPPEGGILTDMFVDAMRWGGFSVISYRPSMIAPAVMDALDHLLITRLALAEEIETLNPRLESAEEGAMVLEELPTLPRGQAYLCPSRVRPWTADMPDLVKFRVGPRTIPHIRHLHKYLRAPLPEQKRFYFYNPDGYYIGHAAANLWEFREAIHDVPLDSLQHHMRRGDFELWIENVLHDEELARRIHKIGQQALSGDALRQTLLEVIVDRYEELESLA